MRRFMIQTCAFLFINIFIHSTLVGATTPSETTTTSETATSVKTATVDGLIFPTGVSHDKSIYSIRIETKLDGDSKHEIATTTQTDGTVAIIENINMKDGLVLNSEYSDPRRQESGKLKIDNNEIFFEHALNGKIKKGSEKLTDNFVTSLSLVDFIQKNWQKLEASEEVKMRFAVIDRQETVGFTLVRQPKMETAGQMVLKMKATSFIIRAIVDPLYFYMDTPSKRLKRFVGRIMPLQKVGDRWISQDAEIIYQM